jgi:hypothetical protein
MMYVLGILAMVTLVGALLFVRGWRGRKVNDHPICGRCGFDLVGTVTAQLGVGAEICPECGASLLVQGMVQHGLKERRKALIAAGVVVLLGSVLGWWAVVFGRL